MRKIILFAASLAAAMTVMSCGDREAEIREKAEYIVREAAEAASKGDYYRIPELEKEEREFCNGMTEEELKIYNQAAHEAGMKLLEEYL
jgi:hypothetical protein